MRVTRRLAFFGLAVFGVVVAIGAVALFASRLPEVDAQLSSKAVPLTVTIISPPNNSHWPMNAYVPVRASLSSRAPLEAIELWSDGMMLDSQPPEAASDPARTFRQWSWAAGKEGDHDLVVRVRTADGRIGTSNVVHVKATAAAETRRLVAAKAGDTLDTLAKAEGVAADQIQRENPGLASDAPLVAGQAVFIAEAPPPVPPGPSLGSLGPGLPPPPLPAPPATIAQAIAPAGQPTAASQTTTVSPQPKPTASQPPVAGGGTAAPSAGGSGQGAASPTPSTGQVPPTPPASGGIDGVKGQWVMSEPHYGEISGLRAFPAWLHDLWQQFGVDLGGGQPPKTPQTAGQSGSDPGKRNTVPTTRNGGTSSATS